MKELIWKKTEPTFAIMKLFSPRKAKYGMYSMIVGKSENCENRQQER